MATFFWRKKTIEPNLVAAEICERISARLSACGFNIEPVRDGVAGAFRGKLQISDTQFLLVGMTRKTNLPENSGSLDGYIMFFNHHASETGYWGKTWVTPLRAFVDGNEKNLSGLIGPYKALQLGAG